MPPRAPALPPDQRRAAIVQAAIGILRRKGQSATTREIAEAAGVAEGTLFRVFPTKEDLVGTALGQAFDPAPALADLRQISPDLDLRQRLTAAVAVLQQHYLEVFELLGAMGLVRPPARTTPGQDPQPGPERGCAEQHEGQAWRAQLTDELIRLARPDAQQLRIPVDELVDLVSLLTFSGSHPILTRGHSLPPQTIVDVLLDGTWKAP